MGNKLLGRCHCQSVKFSVVLSEGFKTVRRCNCSLCRMRGAVVVFAEHSEIDVLEGSEYLTEYRFNSQQAVHLFCSKCGIYTFHQRRTNPNQYGVNVACLESISPFDFATVQVIDGADPLNNGGGGVVGVVTYHSVDV